MLISKFPVGFLALTSVVSSSALKRYDLLQDLQNQAIKVLKEVDLKSTIVGRENCSIQNAPVREDWDKMSGKARKAYIRAVKCMFTSPSKSDPAVVPGAKTRYDDFVAQHINQTLSIHGTGNFLTWHRYFVHGYEKALRDECGYEGYQPYWNWFTYQDNLKKSPVFDGSDTSMGGDGYFVQHNGTIAGGGEIALPSGEGGGCIKSGPFKNLQVNLGPVSPTMDGETKVPTPFSYNPRCGKRDLTNYSSAKWLTLNNLHNITLGAASKSVELFQNELQGRFKDGFLGLHAAGHYAIGGDGGDFFSSPNDPVFFMHHAMLDRVWWIWQALHPKQANTVAGTITIFNNPPSRNTTLEDEIQMNYLNIESLQIRNLMNTLSGGPLCYLYL